MKKLTTLLTVMAMVFVMSGKAQAVPFYYTFSGAVYSIDDSAGIIASQLGAGFGIGSTVTYTFILDFAAPGAYTYNDGTTNTQPQNATSTDFFYADYISGDALVQVGGGFNNAPTDVAEYNYGADYLTSSLGGQIFGNSDNNLLHIFSLSNVATWTVGATVSADDRAWDSTGAASYLNATVTLTSISPVNAVPEPSTLLLLATGLIGLIFFRRKREAAWKPRPVIARSA